MSRVSPNSASATATPTPPDSPKPTQPDKAPTQGFEHVRLRINETTGSAAVGGIVPLMCRSIVEREADHDGRRGVNALRVWRVLRTKERVGAPRGGRDAKTRHGG